MSAASDLGTEDEIRQLLEKIPQLRAEIGKVIIGQQGVIEELLTALSPADIVCSKACRD
jgi:hypothetical protein